MAEDEDQRQALEQKELDDLQSAWQELGISTKVPDLDDLKPDGPYTLQTEIGEITFRPFTVRDCHPANLGVWGQNTMDILQRPPKEILKILQSQFIDPDFSEIQGYIDEDGNEVSPVDEFLDEFGGFEIETCIEYLVRWSGLTRKFDEAQDRKNGQTPETDSTEATA